MQLEVKCIKCKKVYTVDVPKEGFFNWQSGMLIQDAMPDVSADDRELLMSHLCSSCFDDLVGGAI